MLWQVLAAIAAAYVAWLILAIPIRKLLKINLCAICAAVSSTWITLLIIYYRGFEIDPVIPAILMGQSVTGLMYLYERKVKERGMNKLLAFRIFIIIGGALFMYALVSKGASAEAYLAAAVIAASAILLAALLFISGKFGRQLGAVVKKLEECCG